MRELLPRRHLDLDLLLVYAHGRVQHHLQTGRHLLHMGLALLHVLRGRHFMSGRQLFLILAPSRQPLVI